MFTSRRQLIRATAATLAFSGFSRFAAAQEAEVGGYRSEVAGYGPLRRDPAGLFDLPEGFSYTVVSRAGDPMSDGLVTPGKMDGMGCFALDNDRVALVRNHEIKPSDSRITAFGPGRALAGKVAADRVYDRGDDGMPFGGGTTTLVYDLRRKTLERAHLSLAGTSTNCAGGITPWGSWLSCEETTQNKGQEAQKDHGWVFEVPSRGKGLADPTPIEAMGRFRHEAAAVDPRTGVVYMTEDMGDGFGLFYRYLPNDRTRLLAGGKLQALCLPEGADGDPRNWETPYWAVGDSRAVHWVDLDGVDNPYEDLRYRGHAKGAAWFARGEGVFYGQGEIYFACTSGGPAGGGQVMRYVPSSREGQAGETGGRLELFSQPTDIAVMEMCDNIAVAPWGHLFACEDKIGGINFLRAITPQGKIYTLGRNAALLGGDTATNAELAGVCFSPDGTTMFVNIYWPGMTLAVTGPWASFKA
ncbi:alkaline phosphatase PhoX [Phenylobacterium sp.]|uniref:alkaline phosphatase PhoX n=1 Tax=Phenylobacterium sp. TaxID=1871053 RepID=UPI0027246EB0|nr:alkaline phosphatase PhoX [Phenylobacterium sp.]MDO8381167.1 DUF839 domain-containing protein [Phenylobacterium sp.]